MLFTVLDYNNTQVILVEQTWIQKILDTVFGHPEVKPYTFPVSAAVACSGQTKLLTFLLRCEAARPARPSTCSTFQVAIHTGRDSQVKLLV